MKKILLGSVLTTFVSTFLPYGTIWAAGAPMYHKKVKMFFAHRVCVNVNGHTTRLRSNSVPRGPFDYKGGRIELVGNRWHSRSSNTKVFNAKFCENLP